MKKGIVVCAVLAAALCGLAAAPAIAQTAAPAVAQSKNLAPGFTTLAKGAKVVIMPTDIELFSITAGGIPEPKADWTEAAARRLAPPPNAAN